jgi:hypothetical protein
MKRFSFPPMSPQATTKLQRSLAELGEAMAKGHLRDVGMTKAEVRKNQAARKRLDGKNKKRSELAYQLGRIFGLKYESGAFKGNREAAFDWLRAEVLKTPYAHEEVSAEAVEQDVFEVCQRNGIDLIADPA